MPLRWRLLTWAVGAIARGASKLNVDIRNWEPPASKFWLDGARAFQAVQDFIVHFPVLNFTVDSLSPETFDQLVQEGRPFVVRGLGRIHPMREWDCEFFRHHASFQKVQGRREYADSASQQPQWMSLRDVMSTVSGEATRPDSLHASPYYVGIKDVQYRSSQELSRDSHYSPSWTRELLQLVQNHTITPSFMRGSNLQHLKDTPEFWFVQSGARQVGAKPHVDVHPQSTWSLQLCGRKRWRVSTIAPRSAPHVMKLYQDGQIYNRPEHLSWNQFEDIVLHPGDALFFGPAFIHQTLSEESGPAASVTWQFEDPLPVVFMRAFMPRLRFTADASALWPRIQHLVMRAQKVDLLKIPTSSDLQRFLDIDGRGSVNESERQQVVSLWKALGVEVRSKVPKALWQEANLGLDAVIEDQHELADLPKRLRKLVREWEDSALQLDASAALERQSSRVEL